ncbi:MAG: peptidoglycan-binding protein [Synechococcales cyanobacterium T60_A2020_003]|nr:peptidoglycan-binding protein [Synechococcales cyanobacterium T60_A2020_003]
MARRLIHQAVHRITTSKRERSIPPATSRLPIGLPQWAQWGLSLAGCLGLTATLSPAYGQDAVPTPSPAESPAVAPSTQTSIVRPTLRIGSQGDDVKQLQAMLLLLGFYDGAVDGLYGTSTAIAVADFQEVAGLTPDGIMGNASWGRLLPSVADLSREAIASTESTPPAETQPPAQTPEPPVAETPEAAETPASPSATPEEPETPEAPSSESTEASPSTPSSESVDLPILRMGMQGPAVERLQERLQALGFYTGAIDGIFGEGTKSAVETAQRNYDIYPDGVVGPVTWAALLR